MAPAPKTAVEIRRLSAEEIAAAAPGLATVLLDCVAGGASLNFMADLTRERAEAFWRGVAEAARDDGRIMFVAEDAGGVLGTVQMVPVAIDNQPHRADISKMLVHRRGRRRGVGEALMRAAEDAAREIGRTLLTLDTMTGEAGERLYVRLGWTPIGIIPGFALYPDGRGGDTTFFYKRLDPRP
jgi:GNAT superfamily N-acetyltransferase